MYHIEYAALKYYNSPISEECLYIGMLFNNVTTGECNFEYISNFSRFQAFDDEADIDFIKLYLNGIKKSVESSLFDNVREFDMQSYIKLFANEIRFTEITKINVEDRNYVENITKLYLKYDFTKKNRLSSYEEKKYIKKILSSSLNAKFSPSKLKGDYDESINFDYVVNNIGIKLFSFKDKKVNKMISSAKQWSFTADELSQKYKIVFLVDAIDESSKEQKIVKDILKKHATVCPINEGLDHILGLIQN